MDKEIPIRLIELEQKAISIYIENSDWAGVVECLPEDEKEEYWKLFNQTFDYDNGKKKKDDAIRQNLEKKSDEEIMNGYSSASIKERRFYMTELKKRGLR